MAACPRDGAAIDRGAPPPDDSGPRFTLQTGVVYDGAPLGRQFGGVLGEPDGSHARGASASVELVSGHPRNDLRRGGTFLEVQRLVDGRWVRVPDDGDWQTTYRWTRTSSLTGTSKDTLTCLGADTPPGTFRVVRFGGARSLLGRVTPFTGTSRSFTVRRPRGGPGAPALCGPTGGRRPGSFPLRDRPGSGTKETARPGKRSRNRRRRRGRSRRPEVGGAVPWNPPTGC
ncbi:neutral/alkaline non-lysosomal ceramidase C-terminal domain-containing protein [Streptomyces sp. NPDC007883]|uniref:neutral/alkaline non-lysosomal ceramidase C-terminal domain-containing protein n=1 Tax=Streptomyces sp. NPDC007883 TaxID=3155116 RepID=UPI0033EA1B17